MGLLKKLTFVVVVLAVVLGVLIARCPVPDDMEFKLQARASTVMFNGIASLAGLLAKCNLGTPLHLQQTMTEYALRGLSLFGPGGVKEHWETLDGVPVMFHDPEGRQKNGPVFIYIHGGGWALFSPRSYGHVTRSIAKETKYLVMSIDYPMAPNHVYPAPRDACLKVIRHVMKNAEKWGVDKNKIVIGGDSAGGQLTAAVLLELNAKPNPTGPKIAAQVSIYPALQFVDFSLPSFQNDTKVILSKQATVWYSQLHAFGTVDPKRIATAMENRHIGPKSAALVKTKIDHQKLTKNLFHKEYKKPVYSTKESEYKELEKISMQVGFSPLLAESFKGMPPSLIMSCQYDVLRDDAFLYARRLRDDMVKVEHTNYLCFHGSISYLTGFPYFKDIAAFLKKNVEKV